MSNHFRSSIAVSCVCTAIFIATPQVRSLEAQSGGSRGAPMLTDLRNLDDLKTLFDKDVGKFRLVLLLSPTCPVCVVGGRWVQTKILARYPDANLRVYAIWFNMFPGDARSKWRSDLLTDSRVTHWWDDGKVVGRWYQEHASSLRSKLTKESDWNGEILWDAYYTAPTPIGMTCRMAWFTSGVRSSPLARRCGPTPNDYSNRISVADVRSKPLTVSRHLKRSVR